jgi:hypothetical protein
MSQVRGPIVPFAQDQHQAREAPAPMTEEQKTNNVPLVLRRLARHTVYKVGTSEFEVHDFSVSLVDPIASIWASFSSLYFT